MAVSIKTIFTDSDWELKSVVIEPVVKLFNNKQKTMNGLFETFKIQGPSKGLRLSNTKLAIFFSIHFSF